MTSTRSTAMKQLGLGQNLSTKKTRKTKFLDEIERVVPWSVLVAIIEPHCPRAKTGRPPFAVETMLRIHYLQRWFSLSDPAMVEALHDTPVFREFAKIDQVVTPLPDEATILRFRHLLERHNLAPDMLRSVNDILGAKGLLLRTGTVVDATLIAAPSSTKNSDGQRDPEMKQTKKGNLWYFGMKAQIGVDAQSGLVHTVAGTAVNVNDLNMAGALLHGEQEAALGDAGYQGVHKRPEAQGPTWHVAMRRGLLRKLIPYVEPDFMAKRVENMKTSIRAKVEHCFRVIKRQFGFSKVCATGAWPRTRRSLSRCSRCPTCGWRAVISWENEDECARRGHEGRGEGQKRLRALLKEASWAFKSNVPTLLRHQLALNSTSQRVAQTFPNSHRAASGLKSDLAQPSRGATDVDVSSVATY